MVQMNTKRQVSVRRSIATILVATALLGILLLALESNETSAEDEFNCRYVGGYNTKYHAYGVTVEENYAYVADNEDGLIIFDITDKENPVVKGSYNTEGGALSAAVNGNYAYIADYEYGLIILDITDKGNLTKIGENTSAKKPVDVIVVGDYAFVADFDDGLVIFDITDEKNPKKEGSCPASQARGVEVKGDYAYIACNRGLGIFNITDKKNPVQEGNFTKDGSDSEVVVRGDHAYTTSWGDGLTIVNLSDREEPQTTGRYDTSMWVWDLTIDGDYAYLAATQDGLVIVDISDKEHPARKGGYGIPDGAFDVAVRGNYAYVAADEQGLVIVEMAPISHIDSISPDPGAETTNIFLKGHGTDDGEITNYAWRSSIDGEFSNGTASEVSYNKLSPGNHTIYLKVQDDYEAWSDEVNTTLLIHEKPVAVITSVSPSTVLKDRDVIFSGYGIDDGNVANYRWSSSIDGELHNSTYANFSRSNLSLGTHIITFNAQDNFGVWGNEVSEILVVHTKPTTTIISISPESPIEKESIQFTGTGVDDGTIARYVWISSIDGEFYNGTEAVFGYADLSVGTHTINLKVQDNNGVWSDETSTTLVVKQDDASTNNGDNDDDVGFIPGFELLSALPGLLIVSFCRGKKKR